MADRISESGAQRSLVVVAYRLGIMKYLYETYKIATPLVLDSPASSEMDTANLNRLLLMITKKFPEFQIIVATNQKTDVEFTNKITLINGVVDTL